MGMPGSGGSGNKKSLHLMNGDDVRRFSEAGDENRNNGPSLRLVSRDHHQLDSSTLAQNHHEHNTATSNRSLNVKSSAYNPEPRSRPGYLNYLALIHSFQVYLCYFRECNIN